MTQSEYVADGLANYLKNSAPNSLLVSGGRVTPYKLPLHPTLPALSYLRVGGSPDYTHSGESGMVDCIFQVDCWGRDYYQATRLSMAVKRDLSGFHGFFNTPDGQVKIGGIFFRNEMDVPEQETETVHIALTFMVKGQGGI